MKMEHLKSQTCNFGKMEHEKCNILIPPYGTHAILYYTTLYYTILYYTILYYTILYYSILSILYYTILSYTIL